MSYPPMSPTSAVGSLQSEIQSLRSEMQRKVERYEISAITGNVSNLERALGEISSVVDGLCERVQFLEEERAYNEHH